MKRLVALAVSITFALASLAPAVWAQTGTAAPPRAEPKAAAPAPAAPATAAPAPAKPKADDTKPAAKAEKKEKLDINTASEADLKAAGFSGEQAKKVVAGRPWKRKDELVSKGVIDKDAYAKMKGGLIAHQVKDAKTADAKKK